MATILAKKNKDGVVYAYKVVVTLGRDSRNKKIYVSTTIPRPDGMTPKKEEKEVKRLADEWEHEQREEYEKNNGITDKKERKKITFGKFVDDVWMKKHVEDGGHTPDTIAFYKHMSDGCKEYFKDFRLIDISRTDVLDYLAYLRKAKSKKGRPYSQTTVQHYYSTLRSILEYAVYLEYIKENPCKKIKASDKPKREDKEIDFLEEQDAVRFLACLDSEEEKEYWKKHQGTHLQWKALVNILIVTGLRRGELVGLKWCDFDKKNMVLCIRRNVTIDSSSKEKIHIGETKGKKIRRVAISKYIVDLLEELQQERKERYGEEVSRDDYIFCRDINMGMPMYPTEPTRMVRKYIKRHGLPNISPHDLRHTAASLAVQGGASIKEVQALLGHRDAATTLKFYAGLSERQKRGTVDRIEEILRPIKEEK